MAGTANAAMSFVLVRSLNELFLTSLFFCDQQMPCAWIAARERGCPCVLLRHHAVSPNRQPYISVRVTTLQSSQ